MILLTAPPLLICYRQGQLGGAVQHKHRHQPRREREHLHVANLLALMTLVGGLAPAAGTYVQKPGHLRSMSEATRQGPNLHYFCMQGITNPLNAYAQDRMPGGVLQHSITPLLCSALTHRASCNLIACFPAPHLCQHKLAGTQS